MLFSKLLPLATAATALGVSAAIAVAAGCSAQVDPSYRGEPLATVKGSVTTPTAASGAIPALDAAILWHSFRPATLPSVYDGPDGGGSIQINFGNLVGTRVPVSASFPAAFELSAFVPPPPDAQLPLEVYDGDMAGGSGFRTLPSGAWQGYIVALPRSRTEAQVDPSTIAGVDVSHLLLYFDHDGRPEKDEYGNHLDLVTKLAVDYHTPATKGFHLVRRAWVSEPERDANDRCMYNGLCVREAEIPDPYQQARWDYYFGRCLRLLPGAATCTSTVWPSTTPGAGEENERCTRLREEHWNKQPCGSSWQFVPNPDGFASPIQIELGRSFWDAYY